MKFVNFMRYMYFMNKVNKAISLQLTSRMFTTVASHVREHIYRCTTVREVSPAACEIPAKYLTMFLDRCHGIHTVYRALYV